MPKLRFGILLLKLRARIIISCALTLRNLECGGRVTKFGAKVANVSGMWLSGSLKHNRAAACGGRKAGNDLGL